jgi:hypothetical protein
MLEKAQSKSYKWDKDVHRHSPWQGRHLLAIVDSEKRIQEADETNNIAVSDELPTP